jgi:hypothetical protein
LLNHNCGISGLTYLQVLIIRGPQIVINCKPTLQGLNRNTNKAIYVLSSLATCTLHSSPSTYHSSGPHQPCNSSFLWPNTFQPLSLSFLRPPPTLQLIFPLTQHTPTPQLIIPPAPTNLATHHSSDPAHSNPSAYHSSDSIPSKLQPLNLPFLRPSTLHPFNQGVTIYKEMSSILAD